MGCVRAIQEASPNVWIVSFDGDVDVFYMAAYLLISVGIDADALNIHRRFGRGYCRHDRYVNVISDYQGLHIFR